MNAEHLLAHFERISEAPDAIARLRRFILDLAVRGKLVEQDPEDEPVPLLLDEIKSRMRRLRLKHAFSVIDPSEIPFDEPTGWTWCRLGEVCEKTGSGSTPRGGKDVYKNSGVPFLRSQNIYNYGLRLDDVAFIDVLTHERMAGTRVLPCDLLLNITGGSIGRCAKVPLDYGEANISQHVAIIRVAARGMEEFFHSLILSPYFQGFVGNSQTGAGRGGLPKNRMDAIPVPLPPLAEQRRIVAKVDELMALCDQLEAARQQREQGRERLMAATLQRLNQPAEDPASFHKDASFALQVLPSLTTTPAQIKQLRQTILNLAVRGKLVEQDPEDEPAHDSLHRRLAECELRSARFHMKQQASASTAEDLPDPGPDGWCFATPDEIARNTRNALAIGPFGSNLLKADYVESGVPLVFVRDIRSGSYGGTNTRFVSLEKAEELSAHIVRPGDLLVTKMGDPPGDTSIYPEGRPPAIITADCIKLTPNLAVARPEYLRYAIRGHSVIQQFVQITVGVAQQKVSLARFRAIKIPLPPPLRTTPHRRQGGRTDGPLRPAGAAALPGRSATPADAGGGVGGGVGRQTAHRGGKPCNRCLRIHR